MITLESIIKKLGFDPFNYDYTEYYGKKDKDDLSINDGLKSPFTALTLEEKEFLANIGFY